MASERYRVYGVERLHENRRWSDHPEPASAIADLAAHLLYCAGASLASERLAIMHLAPDYPHSLPRLLISLLGDGTDVRLAEDRPELLQLLQQELRAAYHPSPLHDGGIPDTI
jgi:hypothetical protein